MRELFKFEHRVQAETCSSQIRAEILQENPPASDQTAKRDETSSEEPPEQIALGAASFVSSFYPGAAFACVDSGTKSFVKVEPVDHAHSEKMSGSALPFPKIGYTNGFTVGIHNLASNIMNSLAAGSPNVIAELGGEFPNIIPNTMPSALPTGVANDIASDISGGVPAGISIGTTDGVGCSIADNPNVLNGTRDAAQSADPSSDIFDMFQNPTIHVSKFSVDHLIPRLQVYQTWFYEPWPVLSSAELILNILAGS